MTTDGLKCHRRLISPHGDLVKFYLHHLRGVLRRSSPQASGRCHSAPPELRPGEPPVLAWALALKSPPEEPMLEQRAERSAQAESRVAAAPRGEAKPRIATAWV
jgi:hypothetical protein